MGASATTGAGRERATSRDRRPEAFGRGREAVISVSVSLAAITFLLAVILLVA